MEHRELLRCLRSVCAYLENPASLLIVGSQAAFASLDQSEIPDVVKFSREVDVSFNSHPLQLSDAMIDDLNAADFWLGEGSQFALDNGFYMEFVEPSVLILPADWRNHLRSIAVPTTAGDEVSVNCLGLDELAVAKLMRGLDKDKAFVAGLVETGHVDVYTLHGLIEDELEFHPGYLGTIDLMRERALSFLQSLG